MSAVYEGYIIKVFDSQNKSIWDAEAHDMSLCNQVMNDISARMEARSPQINGQVTSKTFSITNNNVIIGSVSISYYGPYFLSDNDFKFIDSLNIILIIIGGFSLLLSIIIGFIMAKRISRPILKTVDAAKLISDGNYNVRIDEVTGTKEIEKLIQSINHLAETLETQEKLRKQLTEDVSHELRTPIAILQSHVEAMIEGVWEPSKERLESCNDEILRIGGLVSDLENLANNESDNLKLNKKNISLSEITNKAIRSFEAKIKNKNLHVEVSGNCSDILADGDKINQVVMNLMSNAIKYTEEGGKIDIELSEANDNVIFNIKDNGIGIADEELPFIFERFYRTDKSRNRETGGSGIGLAIVKSIVEAHGGTVVAESKLDEGTSFEVTLPK
jgi:signal transduction histidine kinase